MLRLWGCGNQQLVYGQEGSEGRKGDLLALWGTVVMCEANKRTILIFRLIAFALALATFAYMSWFMAMGEPARPDRDVWWFPVVVGIPTALWFAGFIFKGRIRPPGVQ